MWLLKKIYLKNVNFGWLPFSSICLLAALTKLNTTQHNNNSYSTLSSVHTSTLFLWTLVPPVAVACEKCDCVVWTLWLCSVQCAVCSVQCAVFSVQCAVCSVQCAVCSVQCSVFSVQCVVYNVQCAVCSVQCAVCSVHSNSVHEIHCAWWRWAPGEPVRCWPPVRTDTVTTAVPHCTTIFCPKETLDI